MTIPRSDKVTIDENVSVMFTCVTSGGLPKPTVTWYNDSRTPGDTSDDTTIERSVFSSYSQTSNNLKTTTSTLTLTTTKFDDQISIYCSACSSPDQTPSYSAQKAKLNVLHSPDGPAIIKGFNKNVPYRVIENRQGQLTCVIKGGNPLPTLTWTCYNIGTADKVDSNTVSKTARWTATRGPDINCTCYYSHPKKSGFRSIKVETLYPPTTPVFHLKSTEVNGTIQIVKHNPVSITCLSTGRPNDIEYSWTSITSRTFGKALTIDKVEISGRYICNVKNYLDQSDGEVVEGSNSAFLDIETLYPPVVGMMFNRSIVEGDTLIIPCPVTVGNPSITSFKWTALNGTKSWNTQILKIFNVSRDDSTVYSCEASNIMKETGELVPISAFDSQMFYLDVLYGTRVTDFYVEGFVDRTSVTVNETENVHMNCKVESNPVSDITIKDQTQSSMKSGYRINSLQYLIASVTCLDAGTYTCFGSNGYGSNESVKQLNLIVNCAPILSPKFKIRTVLKSAELTSAVLTFKCVAYPEPFRDGYNWFRWCDGQWKRLENSQTFQIDTDGLTSNLTVHHVNKTLYGVYKLIVKNTFGQLEQIFVLEPEECKTQSNGIDSNTKAIIIGVILGFIIVILALYASCVTLLLNRKGGFTRDRSQSKKIMTENKSHISTYANFAYSTEVAAAQESLNTKEPSLSEYTALDKKLRSDNVTYEVLDTSN